MTQKPMMTQIIIILFELSSESAELKVAFGFIQPFSVPWRDVSIYVWGFMGWTHEYGEEDITQAFPIASKPSWGSSQTFSSPCPLPTWV